MMSCEASKDLPLGLRHILCLSHFLHTEATNAPAPKRLICLTLGERKSRTNQKRKKADETCKCEKTPEKFVKKSLLFILPHDFKKVESVQIKFLLKDLKFFHYYSNYKL